MFALNHSIYNNNIIKIRITYRYIVMKTKSSRLYVVYIDILNIHFVQESMIFYMLYVL